MAEGMGIPVGGVIARSRALDVPIYAVTVVSPLDDPGSERFAGREQPVSAVSGAQQLACPPAHRVGYLGQDAEHEVGADRDEVGLVAGVPAHVRENGVQPGGDDQGDRRSRHRERHLVLRVCLTRPIRPDSDHGHVPLCDQDGLYVQEHRALHR